jgi:hypothetical protein
LITGEYANYSSCNGGCKKYACLRSSPSNARQFCSVVLPNDIRGIFNGSAQCGASCLNYVCTSPGSAPNVSSQCQVYPATVNAPGDFYTSSSSCTSVCVRYSCNRSAAQCTPLPYGVAGYPNKTSCLLACANYTCSSDGQCIQLSLGQSGPYASLAECSSSCHQYTCNQRTLQCTPSPFGLAGNFKNLDNCKSSCTSYRCNRASCFINNPPARRATLTSNPPGSMCISR